MATVRNSAAIIAAAVITLMIVAGFGLNFYLARTALSTSDHRWCSTLTLLTRRPVPRPADPQANPSREDAYIFYSNLKTLEHQFGC